MRTHERLLQKYIKKYIDEGAKVIRLDHMGVPDAIIIKDGVVSALLIDTSSLNVIAGVIKNKRTKKQRIRDYSEYDKKIQVLPKFSRSVEEYNSAMKMYDSGMTTYRISKNLGINHTTIYEWCKYGVKPRSYISSGDIDISDIIEEMLEDTTIIYDE